MYIAGVINLLIAVFHLLFWHLFNWNAELTRLSAINQTIVQLLDLAVAYTAALFGYISLRHATDLLHTKLGHTMLFLMGLFYLLRAVEGVIIDGLHNVPDIIIFLIGLGVAVLYWIPVWFSSKIEASVSTRPV